MPAAADVPHLLVNELTGLGAGRLPRSLGAPGAAACLVFRHVILPGGDVPPAVNGSSDKILRGFREGSSPERSLMSGPPRGDEGPAQPRPRARVLPGGVCARMRRPARAVRAAHRRGAPWRVRSRSPASWTARRACLRGCGGSPRARTHRPIAVDSAIHVPRKTRAHSWNFTPSPGRPRYLEGETREIAPLRPGEAETRRVAMPPRQVIVHPAVTPLSRVS